MSRFLLILVCWLALFSGAAFGSTYTLNDGTTVSGEPIWPANDNGVVIRAEGDNSPSRIGWDKFSQDALRQLLAQAPDRDKGYVAPLIEPPAGQREKQREARIADLNQHIKEPPKASLPKTDIGFRAIFSSPIGLFMFFVFYGATIFAAFEVALFRNQPVGLVCGLAAVPFLGVLSPIIFVAMPTNLQVEEAPPVAAESAPVEAVPAAHAVAAPVGTEASEVANPLAPESGAVHAKLHLAHEPAAAPAAPLPPAIVFKRGEFSFNRRFFETKLAGFFRLVPSEVDKDMVVFIKSARGDFAGKRIVNINPNELTLQTFKGEATANEVIPFIDVLEVQIRHKNFA
jgi:hypothetical protein